MKILVISSAPIFRKNGKLFAYPPYVDEMDLWFRHVKSVTILSPGSYPIDINFKSFEQKKIHFVDTPFLQFGNIRNILRSLIFLPSIFYKLFKEIKESDHVHLRCPGNISFLGCIVQIFFPKKPKTVKYAGNWDPKSRQPWSYRMQRWILSNTFLSRNIKVLVYGKWPNQSENILPFFTASFSEFEIRERERDFSGKLNFIFVGSLSEGKNPLKAIKIIQFLRENGVRANLRLYGEGILQGEIENYISETEREDDIRLMGFVKKEKLKEIYLDSHFLILPSQSEGWPKAVAEAMFFGCIPVATSVSCVPWMLDNGRRGVIIEPEVRAAGLKLLNVIADKEKLQLISENAKNWSRQYTLEKFENEISRLL